MARHPASRRAHRRRRTARNPRVRVSAHRNPFAAVGDGWLKLTPHLQKITGKRIIRWSSGRREGWKRRDPAAPGIMRFNSDPDCEAQRQEKIAEAIRRLQATPEAMERARPG